MTRAASIAGIVVAFMAASLPAAAETAVATAHATIADPAVVRLSWSLAMPSVRRLDTGAEFIGTTPSLALGMSMPGNARLMLRRQDQPPKDF